MPVLAYGTSVPTPAPPPPLYRPWTGIDGMTWTGWDGSVWDLLSLTSGVVLLNDDVRGLGTPEFTHHTSQAHGVPGARWRGWDTEPRSVLWPVMIYHGGGSREWLRHHDQFMRTLRPDRTGTWEVRSVMGRRRLACRLDSDGSDAYPVDPALLGWHVYGLRLVAHSPWWVGDAVSLTWRAVSPTQRAFLPAAGQQGFYLTNPFTAGSAEVTNPGDADAFPVWTLRGPISAGATVGTQGSHATVTFSLAMGEWLRIDTNPDRLTVEDATGSRFADLTGDVGFPPIPPGRDIPLTVNFQGAGSIEATFSPAYYRAF